MSTGGTESLIDITERGRDQAGQPITMDRRLFVQLLALERPAGLSPHTVLEGFGRALERYGLTGVVYEDVQHPRGYALLTVTEDPADLITKVRPALAEGPLAELSVRPHLCMIGRTYSTGFEHDLEYWLLRRPRQTVLNEAWPWAVWYPLRRKGAFERLDGAEKGAILREHGMIGRAYAEADLAHDVRLACHGLDENDNEFLLGLVGKELYPLSRVVQAMRSTRQTSEFMEKMGPFFVGRAALRHA
ncbi:MAG: chlorite dismutase family protein [Pseudomonadota bacterium]|nr:MAG: hypothetical protein DIU78_08565 [Pseudomonadota bacterium]